MNWRSGSGCIRIGAEVNRLFSSWKAFSAAGNKVTRKLAFLCLDIELIFKQALEDVADMVDMVRKKKERRGRGTNYASSH